MPESSFIASAQEEQRLAFQFLRFAETARKYLHDPEQAELYSSQAHLHSKRAETLFSLAEASKT